MKFTQRLKEAMTARDVTQKDLSEMTGICKSGISQYCSGKNKPGEKALKAIADVLDVDESWLSGEIEEKETATFNPVNIPVSTAAKLMGVGEQFIRVGLQNKTLTFGCAVKVGSSRYTYYISPKKFTEYTGIPIEEERI